MNVLELLRQDGVVARKVSGTKGGEFHGPCPGCGGRDRFHCWPEQNEGEGSWWCRGCDAGGDCIQYLMDYRRMGFREAAGIMGRKLEPQGAKPLSPPRRPVARSWEPEVMREPSERWRQKAGELVAEAHAALLKKPDQLAYLEGRGLPLEAVKRYRLGWLHRDAYRARTSWGLPHEMNPKTGKPKKLWIPMGLVIPIYRDGKLHRLRVRRPKPGKFGPKKYCWVPGSGNGTMVLSPEARAFVAVEAELDAMLCDFATGGEVGALGLGTISAKPDVATHAILSGSLCILNALDFDHVAPDADTAEARREAERKMNQQRRVRDWWQRTYEHAERWPVPEGKDPGEAFERGVIISDWIRAALPPVMLMPQAPAPKPVPEKEAEAQPVAPVPQRLSSPLEQLVSSPIPDVPMAKLQMLEQLLCLTGISLTFTTGQFPFDIPEEFQDSESVIKRLKELCYLDDDVGEYLDAHPVAVITAENLLRARS